MGLKQAFQEAHIVGVDIKTQPNYPFEFHQADALAFPLDGFDFIWASPPCQAHTALKGAAWDKEAYKKKHPDLVDPIRKRLQSTGKPYVIENVPGAPLLNPVLLCGSYFNLGTLAGHQLRRHRLFEANFEISVTGYQCQHTSPTIGIFGNKARNTGAEKRHYSKPKDTRGPPPKDILLTLHDARMAMGAEWMSMAELSEAIPPAYSKYIGEQFKRVFHSFPEVVKNTTAQQNQVSKE